MEPFGGGRGGPDYASAAHESSFSTIDISILFNETSDAELESSDLELKVSATASIVPHQKDPSECSVKELIALFSNMHTELFQPSSSLTLFAIYKNGFKNKFLGFSKRIVLKI